MGFPRPSGEIYREDQVPPLSLTCSALCYCRGPSRRDLLMCIEIRISARAVYIDNSDRHVLRTQDCMVEKGC